MKIKKLNKLKDILLVGLVLSLSLFSMTKAANAEENVEAEFKSVIKDYKIEDVIVENGITLRRGETLDISQYPNWNLSNDKTVEVSDGKLTAINSGTVFLSQEIDDKVYVVEVYVENNIKSAMASTYNTVNRDYYKVFIDPGHGGSDPGSIANGYRESDINLQVAKKIESKLKAKGIEVKMSRTTDIYYTLSERANMSNSYGADAFVSIHQNSFTDPSANGIETYYRPDVSKYKVLSDKIQSNLIKATGARNRGVKTNRYAVLMNTNTISTLVECGFITNPTESKKISDPSYQDKLATAISDAIESYLKENIKLDTTPEVAVNETGVVTADSLNVRSGYSVDYGIIGTLSKGSRVEIVAKKDNWYKIKYKNGYGYVSGAYIKLDTELNFKDINNHWAKNEILDFIKKGYINGYNDNTFRPDNSVTRAEFVKMVNKVFGFKDTSDVRFSDVNKNHWAYNEISVAINAGYIDGYPDNTFKPDEFITREAAAKMISTIMNLKGDGVLSFSDSSLISDWAKYHVDALTDHGILVGSTGNKFNPKNNMTRAEVVVMLGRVD